MTLLCQLLPICSRLMRKVSTWSVCSILNLGFFCLFLCMFACFLQYVVFCTQNKAGNGYLKPAPPWREGRTRTGTNAHTPERRVEMFGIKSLENHLTKMTFLESK